MPQTHKAATLVATLVASRTPRSAAFNGAKRRGDAWVFELPAKSVVVAMLN